MAKNAAIMTKKVLIDRANSRMTVIVCICVFVSAFCLVSFKFLFDQISYQNRVIGAKQTAVDNLKEDLSARDKLVKSYAAFVNAPRNVIGGDSSREGNRDGDNAKIVLDALPSKYDFPALATSLEKLILDQGVSIDSITGTDDEVAQSANQSSSSPTPVAIPFTVQVSSGSYDSSLSLLQVFERSIRPIQIQKLELSSAEAGIVMNIDAKTFYQPSKSLNIKSEVVK